MIGTRVAETILASGYRATPTGRTYGCKRSNQTSQSSCATGAVHIWVLAFARTTGGVARTDDGGHQLLFRLRVNRRASKYSTLPKFGFVVCVAHPNPAKRGGRTSSRAADRAAVDASGAVADVSGRAGQWIEPSPVSDLQAALYERRLRPAKPFGEAGSACVRQNRVVLAVVATVKLFANAALAPTGAVSANFVRRGRPEGIRLPGEHGISRPTIAQGRPCVRLHLYAAVQFFLRYMRTADRGCQPAPGLPRAL
ncbi:hypothetical protein ACVWYH_004931 [Bradyrhizobium sp. GM24.11]